MRGQTTYQQKRLDRVERITRIVGRMLMAGKSREEIASRLGMTVGNGVRRYEAKFWQSRSRA